MGIVIPTRADPTAAPAGYSKVELIRLLPHAEAPAWFAAPALTDASATRHSTAYAERKTRLGDELIALAATALPGLGGRGAGAGAAAVRHNHRRAVNNLRMPATPLVPAAAAGASVHPVGVQLAAVLGQVLPHIDNQYLDTAAQRLAPLFHPVQAPARTPLLRQGEVWQRTFLIQTGLIRMHFVDRDGHEFNKNFFSEGSLICPIAPAMWVEPSLFGIHTIEPTRVWVADAAQWRATLHAEGLWREVQCELLARLLTGKLQREHDLLALDGRARYRAFGQRFPDLAGRVPLKHLASFLGLTDVSLSRLRRADKSRPPHPPL